MKIPGFYPPLSRYAYLQRQKQRAGFLPAVFDDTLQPQGFSLLTSPLPHIGQTTSRRGVNHLKGNMEDRAERLALDIIESGPLSVPTHKSLGSVNPQCIWLFIMNGTVLTKKGRVDAAITQHRCGLSIIPQRGSKSRENSIYQRLLRP